MICPKCKSHDVNRDIYFDECQACGWVNVTGRISEEEKARINQEARAWIKGRRKPSFIECYNDAARREIMVRKDEIEKWKKKVTELQRQLKEKKDWVKVIDELNGKFQSEMREKEAEMERLKELVEWYRMASKK